MKRLLLGAVVLLFGTACSTGTDRAPLEEVSRNLQRLRSGILELRVIASEMKGGPETAGFVLTGSFQAASERSELPVVDLRYRDIVSAEGGGRFISTGDAAYVVRDGRAYELPKRQTQWVRWSSEDPLFEDVELEHWFDDPRSETGEGLDGAAVERLTGSVDVLPAVRDLASLSARFGRMGLFEPLEGREARAVEASVTEAAGEVIAGADDLVMRRLLLEVQLDETDFPLAGMLGGLADAGTLTFDLSISEPNRPVQVEAPADPLPFEELQREVRRRGAWF